jgi:hypothetical protein
MSELLASRFAHVSSEGQMPSCAQALMFRTMVTILLFGAPALVTAQQQLPTEPSPPADRGWRPGLTISGGIATVGTEGTPWTTPFMASIRLELARYLVVEGEWTAPVSASEFIDTGDIGLQELNGQVGIYGRDVRESSSELRMSAVNVLGRAQAKRFSFLGGVGIGFFERSDRARQTRTGCTGPWVPACQQSDGDGYEFDQHGQTLIWIGGMDVNVLPRVDAFVSGRVGGSNGFEEAALAAGVRAALIPERSHRRAGVDRSTRAAPRPLQVALGEPVWVTYDDGREERGTLLATSDSDVTVRTSGRLVTSQLASIRSIETPDSVLNGFIWGAGVGAGVGLVLASYDEPRTLPASVLIGGGLGALLDAVVSRRRLVYTDGPTLRIAPVVSPSVAALGMSLEWH